VPWRVVVDEYMFEYDTCPAHETAEQVRTEASKSNFITLGSEMSIDWAIGKI